MLRKLFMSLVTALFGPPPRTGNRPGADQVVEERIVFFARLPTSSQGLWFDTAFDLLVTWYRVTEAERMRALTRLRSAAIHAASGRSERFALGDHGRAEAEISCALSTGDGFGEEAVHDVVVGLTLGARTEDLELERQRELVWHRAEIAREEHKVRLRRVEELAHEVLHDPLTARVWWFEQHQERWNEIAAAGAALDLLSPRRAHPSESGTPFPEAPEDVGGPSGDPVLDAFLSGLEDWEKSSVLKRLTDILEAFERRDLAERLRGRWQGD